jgi:16S rRNA C967 or C1407 C5-methylase (RsmB/RsmF family)
MRGKNNHLKTGGVLANEVDYKRAWILSHNVKKTNTPNIMVINHSG